MIRWETNFDRFVDKLGRMEKAVPVEVGAALDRLGERFVAKAKKYTSVDTGNLRRSYRISKPFRRFKSYRIVVSNTADYAQHVEWGHRQKRRFLPAKYLDTPNGRQILKGAGIKKGFTGEVKVSVKGDKETRRRVKSYSASKGGIMLKAKFIPGHHMFKRAAATLKIRPEVKRALKELMEK